MINYNFIDIFLYFNLIFFFFTCHDACILKFLERIYYDMYILQGHCFFLSLQGSKVLEMAT